MSTKMKLYQLRIRRQGDGENVSMTIYVQATSPLAAKEKARGLVSFITDFKPQSVDVLDGPYYAARDKRAIENLSGVPA